MPLSINKRPGSPWTVSLVFSGQDLAQSSQGARTEQGGDHEEREADPDNFGAEKRIMVENRSDVDSPSEEEYKGDVESADDVSEDAEEEREEEGEEMDKGQDGDEVEQHDKKDTEEEGRRELENGGEEREASSLVIVVPQRIEITGITIDEETWRIFDAKPIEEKVTILATIMICVFTFGCVLWAMALVDNIVVVVE